MCSLTLTERVGLKESIHCKILKPQHLTKIEYLSLSLNGCTIFISVHSRIKLVARVELDFFIHLNNVLLILITFSLFVAKVTV